jgi:hypothetical protein
MKTNLKMGFLVLALSTAGMVGACSSSSNSSSGTGGASGSGGAVGTGGADAAMGGSGGGEMDASSTDVPANETAGGNAPKDIQLMLINADTASGLAVTRAMPTVDYNVCRQ